MLDSTLFVKHLPPELNAADREELLKLVGAVKVRVMPDTGRMKHTAFATFASNADAKHALSILHQRKVISRCLVVEFAKEQHGKLLPSQCDYPQQKVREPKINVAKTSEKEAMRLDMEEFSKNLHGAAPALKLDYLPSPLLKYKYPPPTPTVLQNITHALASVPKFYTQVLHLMNKMNLPPPFGPLTPAPPLAQDELPIETVDTTECMDMSTEEESEYESEEDTTIVLEKVLPQKRVLKSKQKRKKPKLQSLVPAIKTGGVKPHVDASEVFESQVISQKKINVKKIDYIAPVANPVDQEPVGSFGEIEPSKTMEKEDNKVEEDDGMEEDSRFISLETIRKNRLSSREMKTSSVFKNYSTGDPTCRLYVKNLAKQVEDKDLRYLFGRFLDWNSEQERNMFDIRLMKEGRMKGQAFVTLATAKQAAEALRQTNGFKLHSKPLVVQYARSAKSKDDSKDKK